MAEEPPRLALAQRVSLITPGAPLSAKGEFRWNGYP